MAGREGSRREPARLGGGGGEDEDEGTRTRGRGDETFRAPTNRTSQGVGIKPTVSCRVLPVPPPPNTPKPAPLAQTNTPGRDPPDLSAGIPLITPQRVRCPMYDVICPMYDVICTMYTYMSYA